MLALIGNIFEQRILPTCVGDRLHRRVSYSILARVIAAACLLGLATLASVIGS